MEAALLSGVQLGGLAFFTALAFCGFLAIAGLGDVANDRSGHTYVTPTGGGAGWVAGFGFALAATPFLLPDLGFPGRLADYLSPFLALVFGMAVLGLSDDAFDLSAKLKFVLLLAICGLAVALIGPVTRITGLGLAIELPYALGFTGSVLWVFLVVNAVNFFDGANGMMGVAMVIALLALFMVSIHLGAHTAALLSGTGCAALAGFLPYNLRKSARLFCGDVGALAIGFLYAGTVLILLQETGLARAPEQNVLLIGPILILPLLTDVMLTLIKRGLSGASLLEPHNKHLFRRLIRAGVHPMGVVWGYGLLSLICANVVLVQITQGNLAFGGMFLWLAGGMSAFYLLLSRLFKAHN